MTDTVSKEKRSEVMSLVKSADTKPEIMVRKFLFANGFRFRKNDRRYPGSPDIVLPKYKTVIMVHGCFWHGHERCKKARIPKSNTEFWVNKISRNKERDNENRELLLQLGFKVITLWECDLESYPKDRLETLVKEITEN